MLRSHTHVRTHARTHTHTLRQAGTHVAVPELHARVSPVLPVEGH